MSTSENPHSTQNDATNQIAQDGQYIASRQRQALYRTLAGNIVSQLQKTGYEPHELVGFASEVARAVDQQWDTPPSTDSSNTAPPSYPFTLTNDDQNNLRIVGKQVMLRLPEEADRASLERWGEEPIVKSSLFPVVLDQVVHNLSHLSDQEDRCDFMMCYVPSETPIGLISLHHIDSINQQAELGKMIGKPDYRGKGVAHEATQLILTYGFEYLKLNRIHLRTLGGNLTNIKLNEKMGFRFEGVQREASLCNGQHSDIILMGMLRSEFVAHYHQ